MSSQTLGENISQPEVTNVSSHGVWLLCGNKELFMYYLKTLVYLPNRHTKSKDKMYNVIPQFAMKYKEKIPDIESILLDIGGSNIIIDSERALVALAKIKKDVEV